MQHDRRTSTGARLLSVQWLAQGRETELQTGLTVSGCPYDDDHQGDEWRQPAMRGGESANPQVRDHRQHQAGRSM